MSCTQIGISSSLNPQDENSVLEVFFIERLVKQAVSNSDLITDGTLSEQSSEKKDDVQLHMLAKQVKISAVCVQVFENRGLFGSDVMRLMVFSHRALRSEKILDLALGDIWSFLNININVNSPKHNLFISISVPVGMLI